MKHMMLHRDYRLWRQQEADRYLKGSQDNIHIPDFTEIFKITWKNQKLLLFLIEFPAALLSVLGNALVLFSTGRRFSVLKAPELLTVNLAVTDIGMALSMYPLSIASAFNHAWMGGDASCLYYGLMGMIFSITSIMTLAVMGMIRYLVTGSPPRKGRSYRALAYVNLPQNNHDWKICATLFNIYFDIDKLKSIEFPASLVLSCTCVVHDNTVRDQKSACNSGSRGVSIKT